MIINKTYLESITWMTFVALLNNLSAKSPLGLRVSLTKTEDKYLTDEQKAIKRQ